MRRNMVGLFYNISRKLYLKKVPIFPKLIWTFNRIIFSCDLPFTAKISSNVTFQHNALGVVVHKRAVIGENCVILHNVTIGGNMGKSKIINDKKITFPIIGDNVLIGTGAKILGPVVIGDNAKIGAGSIVLSDIPPGSTAIGVPAKVIS